MVLAIEILGLSQHNNYNKEHLKERKANILSTPLICSFLILQTVAIVSIYSSE